MRLTLGGSAGLLEIGKRIRMAASYPWMTGIRHHWIMVLVMAPLSPHLKANPFCCCTSYLASASPYEVAYVLHSFVHVLDQRKIYAGSATCAELMSCLLSHRSRLLAGPTSLRYRFMPAMDNYYAVDPSQLWYDGFMVQCSRGPPELPRSEVLASPAHIVHLGLLPRINIRSGALTTPCGMIRACMTTELWMSCHRYGVGGSDPTGCTY
ncbi:uncharacterized protein C8Q71DRAFT_61975 [Rhodofomes roseus]|uniref:Uncharacterized protein n=1 Tax=Rhodofomes roseus TaxID=34475 RepID=A0ABQ8KGB6_9APHY|nr:uncharacterized protein C8Q71DRAFT_61975 [Rhodofomes roseus]KAH9836829.1 hypothetical protein C8Q71DRAFT_61975 [Rhodofomes roseus]